MRLVLDTNVVVSGLLWRGAPGSLIDPAIEGRLELATSPALLVELEGVLARPRFSAQFGRVGLQAHDLFDGYAALSTLWRPAIVKKVIIRDPDDDQVLAAAIAASADLIVSGDSDLLDLGTYRGIAVVTAVVALRHCELAS